MVGQHPERRAEVEPNFDQSSKETDDWWLYTPADLTLDLGIDWAVVSSCPS
jgi:hypothetical protein